MVKNSSSPRLGQMTSFTRKGTVGMGGSSPNSSEHAGIVDEDGCRSDPLRLEGDSAFSNCRNVLCRDMDPLGFEIAALSKVLLPRERTRGVNSISSKLFSLPSLEYDSCLLPIKFLVNE